MANIRQAGSRPGRSRPFRRVLTGCFQPPVPPPALPLWMVVDERVRLGAPPVGLDQEWGVINCSKKTAYGCGKHGQKVLDGLRLRMRLVKPNGITTSIYLELNNDALRALRAAFGKGDGPPIPIDGKELHARGAVSTTSDQVLVLVVVFRLRGFGTRIFYMVYDTIDGSLAMVPAPPDPSCDIDGMPKPLAVPRDRSNHGVGYDLLFLSRKRLTSQPGHPYNTYEDVVYRWTPGAWSEDGGPWRVQRRRFANGVHEAFIVESMFTMKGQAFFADLAQGLIHCDLSTTTEGSVVDFHFIPLPEDAPLESRWAKVEPEDMGPINWYRTLSCTSGSIKFVCIDRSTWPPENMRLIQYTLDLSSKKWSKNMELRSVELWKFLGLKKEMLPETVPKCPVLMSDDSLSLLLPNMRTRKEDSIEDYMCNFKLGQKVRLSWSAHLDHCYYTEPIILPWNFFKTVQPPVNVKPRRAIFL